MQKFLITLITTILERYVVKWYKQIDEIRKNRKVLKEIKKENNAKVRAQRLKDFINK